MRLDCHKLPQQFCEIMTHLGGWHYERKALQAIRQFGGGYEAIGVCGSGFDEPERCLGHGLPFRGDGDLCDARVGDGLRQFGISCFGSDMSRNCRDLLHPTVIEG